jgi:hypothetical protein
VWKATYPLQHWKLDNVETESSQIAVARHQHAASVSSLPTSASPLRDHPHASTRREFSPDSVGNQFPAAHEATDDFLHGVQEESARMWVGEDESAKQSSSEGYLQSLHDSAETKFIRAHMNEGIQTAQEDLSKMCLDADDLHPSVHAPSDTCRTRLTLNPSSFVEDIGCSEDDSNTVAEEVTHEIDATQEVVSGLRDRHWEGKSTWDSPKASGTRRNAIGKGLLGYGEVQSTRDSTHAAGKRRKTRRKGLLGENGKVLQAAIAALGEIKDVHTSDELMHFEFCGPFWELSEV